GGRNYREQSKRRYVGYLESRENCRAIRNVKRMLRSALASMEPRSGVAESKAHHRTPPENREFGSS
ncbi:1871_t:CDS:1, partial [Paraglomus occultum]